MRTLIIIFIIICTGFNLMAQSTEEIREGAVSYITTQSVYVKFNSTKNIAQGDTLFIKQGEKLVPALTVKNLSSISCVCSPVSAFEFNVSDVVIAKIKVVEKPPLKKIDNAIVAVIPASEKISDSIQLETDKKEIKQDISGRISVSSYSNIYSNEAPTSQRMRYTFSLRGNNLRDSKLSIDSYITFVHSNTKWDEIKENIFNGLKIYKLAVKYDFNETTKLIFGRSINPKLSSVGAIDGLQFEKKINSFTVGAIAGSRPDYQDYSINTKLLQYGAYFGHGHTSGNLTMQSSMAIIEQTNNSKTDRRFIYFQHSNSIVKNVFFFGSAEFDLYKKVTEKQENTLQLTNLYLSLRYRVIKQLSLTVSYSNRQNVIYYETYKNFIDRLLESEVLQGWHFRVNYRPVKYLSIGINAGYRYRKPDPSPTRNLHSYITYSRVPGINAAATLSVTLLETAYLSGNIYSLGLSRDLIPGKVSGGIKYRNIDYNFVNSEIALVQNVGEINLSWKIYKKLSMSVYYEGTFEKEYSSNRIYINITQRF